jgi:hypothetical protein
MSTSKIKVLVGATLMRGHSIFTWRPSTLRPWYGSLSARGRNTPGDIWTAMAAIWTAAKTTRLNLPGDAPAEKFMSIVVYDSQTRFMLQTDQPYPNKNNKRDKLIKNDDGSIDLYFGPRHPRGKKRTGSRLFRKRAGSACCDSTAQPSLGSTRPGDRAKSSW